jgi:hypothetical protein
MAGVRVGMYPPVALGSRRHRIKDGKGDHDLIEGYMAGGAAFGKYQSVGRDSAVLYGKPIADSPEASDVKGICFSGLLGGPVMADSAGSVAVKATAPPVLINTVLPGSRVGGEVSGAPDTAVKGKVWRCGEPEWPTIKLDAHLVAPRDLTQTPKLVQFVVESSTGSWFALHSRRGHRMPKKGHSEEKILRTLREVETGAAEARSPWAGFTHVG